MTLLEVKGAAAAIVTSAIILAVTVIAGGIYRNRSTTKTQPENKPVGPESMIAKKRSFFLQSCAHCHGTGRGWRRRCSEPFKTPN
jgi:hypothetical protein